MTIRRKKTQCELEDQLAGVIEQDGITMATPHGLSRRAQRVKGRKNPFIFRSAVWLGDEAEQLADAVADLDRELIQHCCSQETEISLDTVPVNVFSGHDGEQSAYVLSLKHCDLGHAQDEIDERDLVGAAWASQFTPEVQTPAPDIYRTLTRDLMLDGYDPHVFAEQFTPSTFHQAHALSYSPLKRLESAGRVFVSDVASLFHRLEAVERQVVRSTEHLTDEVRDSVAIIEMPRLSSVRVLIGFACLLLIVTLPANAVMLYRSAWGTRQAAEQAGMSALGELTSAADQATVQSSHDALQRASARFREADAILNQSSALALGLASLAPSKYSSARALMEVGDKASEAGRLLALGLEKVFSEPDRRLDERLGVLAAYARGVLPLLADASRAAAKVDASALPEARRADLKNLVPSLDKANRSVTELAEVTDFLIALMGPDFARTYLLVFQNQTELRPSGGFMGSVAEVTVDRGAVTKIFVPPGGTYDLKGQLTKNIISPEPLQLINSRWQFQDANWFPDFPTTAKKIRWFWSQSGQPTLDGVVAINASFVEKILDVTGPIAMPEYGKIIDRQNFMLETQKAVELEYDKQANTPKKFIGDLTSALMERVKTLSQDDWLALAALISESLDNKDIQIALSDAEEEARAERYGWNGLIKPTNGDALAIIESNIAGQKTDGVIAEQVEHQAEALPDGSIVDQLTLTRTHQGKKGELFRGVRNVSYVRFYVPLGSKLIEAKGFTPPPQELFKPIEDFAEPDADLAAISVSAYKHWSGADISVESGRTVFGGWLQLDPGKAQTLTLKYKLPFTLQDIYGRLGVVAEQESASIKGAYTLLLTSQSGKTARQIRSTLKVPDEWAISWSRGVSSAQSDGVMYSGPWDRDRVMAGLLLKDPLP